MSDNSQSNTININQTVIYSPNDKNKYYRDILPNGLQYVVIENPSIDRSAVGLDVYVGSADDPREYQGLAHCLEHTILLGTKKYPEASSFDNFVNDNSGINNANTSLESTNYQYDISHEALEESISRFCEFFKTPLFTKELIDKELNAIENEFKLDYRKDSQRLTQLILSEGYPNSTINTFINGNSQTLKKDDIREKVMEFYNNKYDAKIMALSIFSNKSIEELKNLVAKYFSDIKSVKGYQLTKKNILYDNNNMGYLYKMIPIKDYSFISFQWIINKTFEKYNKTDPMNYIISLLGHETKHSLTSYLKKTGYIYSLLSSHESTLKLFTEITIKIKLTEEGYKNYEKVISIVLSYLNYLQKEEIHKDFFEEIKHLSEIEFFLDSQNEPIDFCESVARTLNKCKKDEPFYIASKIEEYNPVLIKEILNSLTTQNLNIYLMSHKLKEEKEYLENKNLYNIEKIYGTEYMKIKKNFSENIADIKSFPESDLAYPELNPFIAKDLSMIDLKKENINIEDFVYPKKMCDNESIIWYKPIIKYNMPRVHIIGKAYISNMNLNYENYYVYFDIFQRLCNKEMSDFNYFGEVSENRITLSCSVPAILIKASGYTDSLENYLTESFNNLLKLIDIEKIDNIIDKLHKILDELINFANNLYKGDVKTQVKLMEEYILKKLKLKNKMALYEKLRDELNQNKIPEDFLYFIRNFLKKVKYEWIVEGNILYKDAERIIKKMEKSLNNLFGGINPENNSKHKEPLSINEIRKQKITKLSNDKIYRYNFSSKDEKNESSVMMIYYQIDDLSFNNNIFNPELYEQYLKYTIISDMIFYIFNELFYDELRTQQQLGYDVSFSSDGYGVILGIKFYISSSKYDPDEILEHINKFIIKHDLNKEENFTDENYEQYKKAILVDLMEKPLTLSNEFNRDYPHVLDRAYTFDEREKLIKYIKEKLSKKDVIEFFNNYIFNKAKRLEIALYSSIKKENKETKMEIEENSEDKKDIEEKSDTEMNERKDSKNEDSDDNKDILPSYQNMEKVIIKDIDDFHRLCNYYDVDIY